MTTKQANWVKKQFIKISKDAVVMRVNDGMIVENNDCKERHEDTDIFNAVWNDNSGNECECRINAFSFDPKNNPSVNELGVFKLIDAYRTQISIVFYGLNLMLPTKRS